MAKKNSSLRLRKLNFFKSKPTKTQVMNHFGIPFDYFEDIVSALKRVDPIFRAVVLEFLYESATFEQLSEIFKIWDYSYAFSIPKRLIDKYFSFDNCPCPEEDLKENLFLNTVSRPYFCSKYYEKFGRSAYPICHLYTRNTLREVSIDIFSNNSLGVLNTNMFRYLMNDVYNLYQLEMFSKLIRTGKINSEALFRKSRGGSFYLIWGNHFHFILAFESVHPTLMGARNGVSLGCGYMEIDDDLDICDRCFMCYFWLCSCGYTFHRLLAT